MAGRQGEDDSRHGDSNNSGWQARQRRQRHDADGQCHGVTMTTTGRAWPMPWRHDSGGDVTCVASWPPPHSDGDNDSSDAVTTTQRRCRHRQSGYHHTATAKTTAALWQPACSNCNETTAAATLPPPRSDGKDGGSTMATSMQQWQRRRQCRGNQHAATAVRCAWPVP